MVHQALLCHRPLVVFRLVREVDVWLVVFRSDLLMGIPSSGVSLGVMDDYQVFYLALVGGALG